MRTLLKEFWDYLLHHKSSWLIPLIIVLLLLACLLIFSQGSALSPFMYR